MFEPFDLVPDIGDLIRPKILAVGLVRLIGRIPRMKIVFVARVPFDLARHLKRKAGEQKRSSEYRPAKREARPRNQAKGPIEGPDGALGSLIRLVHSFPVRS